MPIMYLNDDPETSFFLFPCTRGKAQTRIPFLFLDTLPAIELLLKFDTRIIANHSCVNFLKISKKFNLIFFLHYSLFNIHNVHAFIFLFTYITHLQKYSCLRVLNKI